MVGVAVVAGARIVDEIANIVLDALIRVAERAREAILAPAVLGAEGA